MNSLEIPASPRRAVPVLPTLPLLPQARVLLVDDDVELGQMLGEYLLESPLDLACVHDGGEASALLERERFDLVVLDIMLPTLDGYALLRRLRASGRDMPVLMLSARGADEDRIMGLEAGADDYLPKPFNPRELRARILAMLRRLAPLPAPARAPAAADREEVLRLGTLALHARHGRALAGEQAVALTGTEARILELLMRGPDRPVQRAQLTRWVLGRELLPSDRSLDTHVSNLRRKLGLNGATPGRPVLRSLRGVGYVLNSPTPASPSAGPRRAGA